jgi:hypothetical protein
MVPCQIVKHQPPENESANPSGDETDCQSADRSEQREYAEDDAEGPRPTSTMKKTRTSGKPNETKEENTSINDQRTNSR